MQLVSKINFQNLGGDIFGGLTAAVLVLPIALTREGCLRCWRSIRFVGGGLSQIIGRPICWDCYPHLKTLVP